MQTRVIARAVVVIGLGFGRALEGQTSNLAQLWQVWNEKYKALEGAPGCRGSEVVYLDAYKYSVAYFYSRMATLPLPNDAEGRSLAATLGKAERDVTQCLRVGPPSGLAGRSQELPTSDAPSGIQKFFSGLSAAFGGQPTTGVVDVVEPPPQRLQPPPADVNPGVDHVAVMRLQSEADQLRQNLANVQIENGQLRTSLAELNQVATEPSGVWKVTIAAGNQTMSQDMAITRKGEGFTIYVFGGEEEMHSVGRDPAGRWIFTAQEAGQTITMYLDLNSVQQTRHIRGTIQTPQGIVQIVGLKLGDRRIPR